MQKLAVRQGVVGVPADGIVGEQNIKLFDLV